MQIDPMVQLEELIRAFGVNVMRLDSRMPADTEYDRGLRRCLQYPNDILSRREDMEEYYKEKTLYIVRDAFEEGYMSFLIPEAYRAHSEKEFLLIGLTSRRTRSMCWRKSRSAGNCRFT